MEGENFNPRECSCEEISTRKLREVSFYYIMRYMYHLICLPRKQSLGVYMNHHAPVEIHLRGLKFSPSITCNIIVHVCPDIYMY
jgi:hypothetical protein